MPRVPPHSALHHVKALALMVTLALPLAGCLGSGVDRVIPTSTVSDDYHLRHPVVLANAPHRMDIFFVGAAGQLDDVQDRQLEAFARDYRETGQGGVQVALPEGAVDHRGAEVTLGAVRRALLRYGVKDRVVLTTYAVSDPSIASPLHLSFLKLQARPASRCGDWPDDLGSGASVSEWDNRSYYNLGCASQQTLAAQIADPRDLVRPHAEDPTDVQLRTRAIGSLRGTAQSSGIDPSTTWTNNPTVIGPVGGF